MRRIIFKMLSVFLLIALLLGAVGCVDRSETNGNTEDQALADCVINGRSFFFVKKGTKQTWEEPLAKLLSNVLVPYGEHGDILGYRASVDPNAPVIPQSFECGLLDVTGDGTPELLVHPLGYSGSSGNTTYFVYNFHSGQKLGEITGGNGQSFCYYYNVETDDLSLVAQYWLRGGWSWRGRYLKKIFYDEAVMECWESVYLHTAHDISGEETDITNEDSSDMFYTATWGETYPNTEYYVHNKKVYLDDYYAEYNQFVMQYVRIPETELVRFTWDDVCNDEDDYVTKGKKMANALVNSQQAFLLP